MRTGLSYACIGALLLAPMLVPSAAMDTEGEVEIVEVSATEVAVVADEANDVIDTVTEDEVTVEALGPGDCNPLPNSTGFPAYLQYAGGAQLLCVQMPAGNWSQLVAAPSTVGPYPFLGGNLCLNPFQMVKAAPPTLTGVATFYSVTSLGSPVGTWHFQVMYRDPGFGFGANLSSLHSVADMANF